MSIHQSGEMYLKTILLLSKEIENVRSVDVANYMDFSKPSVCNAIKKLKNDGLINVSPEGYLSLTEIGSNIANKVHEKHSLITSLLISFGVDEETAKNDAGRIEHVISDESFEAIKRSILDNK